MIDISVASEKDLDMLLPVWYELMDYHKPYHKVFHLHKSALHSVKEELRKRLNDPQTRIFIALTKDEIVGMLICRHSYSNSTIENGKKGYIAETIVCKSFRGKGIGKQLFDTAKQWLIAQQVTYIELQVVIANEQAVEFWQEMGFRPLTYHMMCEL